MWKFCVFHNASNLSAIPICYHIGLSCLEVVHICTALYKGERSSSWVTNYWSTGLGLKGRGDVGVPRPPPTCHERPEGAGEPDEVHRCRDGPLFETHTVLWFISIVCAFFIDSANPILTIFSLTFPSRLPTDHFPIILGKWERAKSEKSEACQENLCGTSGEGFQPARKKWFSQKITFSTGQCLATCEQVLLESLNRRLAIFPELLSDQPRKPTLLSEFEFGWSGLGFFLTLSPFRSFNVIAEEE